MKTNDEALLKIKYDVLRTVSKLAFDNTAAMSCEPRPSLINAACKAIEGEFWAKA